MLFFEETGSGSTVVAASILSEKERIQLNNCSEVVSCNYNGEHYYAQSDIAYYEQQVARMLITRRNIKIKEISKNDIDRLISEYEEGENISLSNEQKEGVEMFLNNNISILTGGPGTGKTSVLKCIIFCIENLFPWNKEDETLNPILCLSPTGKAAKRMSEATEYNAKTILGAIKFNPVTKDYTAINRKKFILVDECSMMDIETTYAFLCSLENNLDARILFVGDTEQLPSVGAGSVLRDMLTSNMIAANSLVKTFRQKEGSTLLENIGIIKKGCNYPLVEGNDFVINEDVNSFLPLYYKTVAEVGYQNVVVLTPNRKAGINCSQNLNKQIQARLNQRPGFNARFKRDGKMMNISFRYGDPVIQLVNREVANGEVGVVVYADKSKIIVKFSEKQKITYTEKTIEQLDLAYAISIHKSQGSEYPIAFVLCDKSRLLDKNMIYTAVTRAKKKCFLFGEQSHISAACKKESTWDRTTALSYRIREEAIYWIIRDAIFTLK